MAVKFLYVAVIFLITVEMGFLLPVGEESSGDESFSGQEEITIPDCSDTRAAVCHLTGCTKVFRKACFGPILDIIKSNLLDFLKENDLEATELKTTADEFTLEASTCPSKSALYVLFQGLCSARLSGGLSQKVLNKCDCPF